jgi:hypothetical protein
MPRYRIRMKDGAMFTVTAGSESEARDKVLVQIQRERGFAPEKAVTFQSVKQAKG